MNNLKNVHAKIREMHLPTLEEKAKIDWDDAKFLSVYRTKEESIAEPTVAEIFSIVKEFIGCLNTGIAVHDFGGLVLRLIQICPNPDDAGKNLFQMFLIDKGGENVYKTAALTTSAAAKASNEGTTSVSPPQTFTLSGANLEEMHNNLQKRIEENSNSIPTPTSDSMIELIPYMCYCSFLSFYLTRVRVKDAQAVASAVTRTFSKNLFALFGQHVGGLNLFPVPSEANILSLINNISQDRLIQSYSLSVTYFLYLSCKGLTTRDKRYGVLQAGNLMHASGNGMGKLKMFNSLTKLTNQTQKFILELFCTTTTANATLALATSITNQEKAVSYPNDIGEMWKNVEPISPMITWQFARIFDDSYYNNLSSKFNLRLTARYALVLQKYSGFEDVLLAVALRSENAKEILEDETSFAEAASMILRGRETDRGIGVSKFVKDMAGKMRLPRKMAEKTKKKSTIEEEVVDLSDLDES